MRILAIIQARVSSTRLRGKILKELAGAPLLYHVVARTRAAHCWAADPTAVMVATSTEFSDEAVAIYCKNNRIPCYRGSLDDVLDRYVKAATPLHPEIVVRVTADCPLVSPEGIDEVVNHLIQHKLDYCFCDLATVPLGVAVEAVSFAALQQAHQHATAPDEREHVPLYIRRRRDKFRVDYIRTQLIPNRPELRLTVDTPEDYQVLAAIYQALYRPGELISLWDVAQFLDANPEVAALNRDVAQKKVDLSPPDTKRRP